MNRTVKTAAVATLVLGVSALTSTVDEPADHPVCQRTDSGWAVVPYDDATGSWTTAVLPYNGTCPDVATHGELRFVKPTPAPVAQVRTVTVVRTKTVTRTCTIKKRPGPNRRCSVKVRWSR